MINFSTLQGLTIPEGVVTQIADASGRVLWAVANDEPVILEVRKITSDTYAAETTYTGEQFILLDIYPKTNGTVKVTYGGLTKTIADTSGAAEPNAQQVFFGTFNGVSDGVETPMSGTLTIEGRYRTFGVGAYKTSVNNKTTTNYCDCVTAFVDTGSVKTIVANAFKGTSMTSVALSNLDDIQGLAFSQSSVTSVVLTNVKRIYESAFTNDLSEMTVTVNGLPEVMQHFAFRTANHGGCDIHIVDSQFDWDKWAQADSRPCLEIIETETTGGTYDEEIKVFINDVSTYNITDVSLRACTNIGAYAFCNFGAKNYIIPESVTNIGEKAFHHDSVVGPFFIFTILATTPPTVHTSAFTPNSIISITVPKGCGEAYKAADGWSAYADRIMEAT